MFSRHFVFIVILAICTLGLTVAPPGAQQAYAGQEDAALFQEALANYGQWLNHGQYGLVWRPRQVNRDWRPYTNGRWVPTPEGYVFETDEPWGWATYHYGNWLPTRDNGWVWVPGRTWYPHTVNWRTNDENVGWAPVPPPYYVGAENYSASYPGMSYDSSSGLNSYGSYPYNTLASSWIFTRAADFLLGWGQPYSSVYSYASTGLLLGPQYIPTVYERTVYVTNYVSPSYATNAFYNWGPPLTYITRVTKINNIEVDRRYKHLHLSHLHNVMPPSTLRNCHPAWREVLPMNGTSRQGHLRSVPNFSIATGKLNYPDAIPAPASLRPSQNAARPSANLKPNQPAAPDKTHPPDNRQTGDYKTRFGQLNQPPNQSAVPDSANAVIHSSNYGLKKKPESKNPSNSASPGEPAGQQTLVSPPRRQYQSRRESHRVEPPASQENQVRRYQADRLEDQQRAEQELKMRQQQRLEMERRQQEAKSRHIQEQQARSQQQVQMEQQRRVEMMRQQQMQQQRQAEMQQQQQRQAEMQQRQADLMRAQQIQHQQQMIRHSQPPPQRATAAPTQKKRDNQQQ